MSLPPDTRSAPAPAVRTLRFSHVAIIGKYQAPGSRDVVDEVAHFLHDEGCDVSLERETALNTGLLFDRVAEGSDRMAWGLSPAFDITPNVVGLPSPIADGPHLSLATGTDGRSGTSMARLADAAQWMGLERDDAIQWLMNTARQVAGQWAPMLRAAAGPVIEDATRLERLVGDVRPSFAYAEWLAQAS